MAEHQEDYPSVTAASQAVAKQLGLGRETVRRWVVQAENRRLREDVEILKAATSSWAGFAYVACIVDVFAQKIVAVAHALNTRPRVPGAALLEASPPAQCPDAVVVDAPLLAGPQDLIRLV